MQIKHSESKIIFKFDYYGRFIAGSIVCETTEISGNERCACAVSAQTFY